MAITSENVISLQELVSEQMVQSAAATCTTLLPHVTDRADLHQRDPLERFSNLLMGEIAELGVIAYLQQQGKYAVSAVDKQACTPDQGHDIHVRRKDGSLAKCSVKSSLSYKYGMMPRGGILEHFRPAFNRKEPRDINVQVYFHYQLGENPRATVLTSRHAFIVGWLPERKIVGGQYTTYQGERRPVADIKLKDMLPMSELLPNLS